MIEKNKSEAIEIPVEVIPITPKPKINFRLVFIIILLLSLFSLGIVYAYNLGKQNNLTTLNPTPTPIMSAPTPAVEDLNGYGSLSWLSTPKKVSNPDILVPSSDDNYTAFAELGTYEVGKFKNGGSLLVTFVQPEGPSSPMIFRLILDKNKYYLIESLINDEYLKKNIDKIFDLNKIKLISYLLKELSPDSSIGDSNQNNFTKILSNFGLPSFFTELKNYKLFYKSTFGNIYTTVNPIDNKYISEKSYYLVLNDFTVVGYSLISNFSFSGDKVTLFKHLDNTQNTAQFRPISSGCGGDYYSSIITDSSLLDKKNLIGNSDDGFQVFQITSADSPLVQFLYKQYKVGRDYPSAPPIISLDQFAQAPNHIIYQETNGDWVILTNPEYSVQAECGKPVIYLYPEKDTQVSVKVGANITKSEPTYPRNGWTVLAHPNGQLDYQNSVYPNLFWEGTGLGIYANHAGEGFVVPQSKLISTINSHLKLQGLNTQESKDFMEFWTDKLPQTPYVRLTWLDTTDMNVLAPLSVSPRPKSVIRIFLEFEGLEKNIYLKPQKLTTINRDGFTLVEWGGLLR